MKSTATAQRLAAEGAGRSTGAGNQPEDRGNDRTWTTFIKEAQAREAVEGDSEEEAAVAWAGVGGKNFPNAEAKGAPNVARMQGIYSNAEYLKTLSTTKVEQGPELESGIGSGDWYSKQGR